MAAPQLFALRNHAGLRRADPKVGRQGRAAPWAGFQDSPHLTDEETEAQGTVGSGSMLSFGDVPHLFHFDRQFLNCLVS